MGKLAHVFCFNTFLRIVDCPIHVHIEIISMELPIFLGVAGQNFYKMI